MKTFKTNRRFYKKWLYKVSLQVEGAAMFRMYSLEEIQKMLKVKPVIRQYGSWAIEKFYKNKIDFSPLIDYLLSLEKSIWTKRVESNGLDIYTNDITVYDHISLQFSTVIRQRFEPEESKVNLLEENSKTIICEKLPHNKYQYRVYLKPHVLSHDLEGKKKYVNWLTAQQPKITCTPAIQEWFIKTNWNWDRRYVLVEDECTLLFLKLRNSDVVGTVYNYVVVDK